jgi:hypothetical protein
MFSLPGFAQHFYDTAGHVLAYQKGVVLYTAQNKPIGHIWPGGFKDTTNFEVIGQDGNKYFYTEQYRFKYKDVTGYTGVYEQGTDVFNLPYRHNIGEIVQYDIFDADGIKIGRIDKGVPEAEAIIFYFLLLPIYGGTK